MTRHVLHGLVAVSLLFAAVQAVGESRPKIDMNRLIVRQAAAQGVPEEIAIAVAKQESGMRQWRKDGTVVVGDDGKSIGVFQVNQASAPGVNLNNPYQNVKAGVSYLRKMYNRYGNWSYAVSAYNMGPGRVDYNLRKGIPLSHWRNFRTYVSKILPTATAAAIPPEGIPSWSFTTLSTTCFFEAGFYMGCPPTMSTFAPIWP